MAIKNYDFRILMETISGSKLSYGTASLVSQQTGTSVIINTSDMVDRINNMPSQSYYNGPTFATSSEALMQEKGASTTFQNTQMHDTATDWQFLSCSINGQADSGSIIFHSNTLTTSSLGNDYLKRYKFWGSKVCGVLGVPENYWIYSDAFRLTNTGSEANYLSGDVLAESVNVRENFAISSAGSVTSDVPFRLDTHSDRWLRFTDVSSSTFPQNRMLIGYSQDSYFNDENDSFVIKLPHKDRLHISASELSVHGVISASGYPVSAYFDNDISASDAKIILEDNSQASLNASNLKLHAQALASTPAIDLYNGHSVLNYPGISWHRDKTEANSKAMMGIRGILADHSFDAYVPSKTIMIVSGSDAEFRADTEGSSVNDAPGAYFTFNDELTEYEGIKVGIRTSRPTKPLQVKGDISASGHIHLNNQSRVIGKDTSNKDDRNMLQLNASNETQLGNIDGITRIYGGSSDLTNNYFYMSGSHIGVGYTDVGSLKNSGPFSIKSDSDNVALTLLETGGGYERWKMGVDVSGDFKMWNSDTLETSWSLQFHDGGDFSFNHYPAGGVNNKARWNFSIGHDSDGYQDNWVKFRPDATAESHYEGLTKGFVWSDDGDIAVLAVSSSTNPRVGIGNALNPAIMKRANLVIYTGSTGKTLDDIDNTAYSLDSWNQNGQFQIEASNNALSFIVDGTTNGREAMLQVGHSSPQYAAYPGELKLNPFGGGVSAGPSSTAIQWKTFTGTLGVDPSTTTVSHGVTSGKKRIVAVNVNVQTTETEGSTAPDNSFIASQGVTNDGGDEGFYVYFDDSNVYIVLDSDSDALDDSRYTMMVTYTTADLY